VGVRRRESRKNGTFRHRTRTKVYREKRTCVSTAAPAGHPSPMTRLVSILRASVQSLGWGNGLLYLLARALSTTTRGRSILIKYYFVVQPVPRQPLEALPRSSKTRVYQVSATDDIIRGFPRPAPVIAQRFADGAVCFVAENSGNLVGFIWLRLDRYDEDEVRCDYRLEPRGVLAWDFDAYVAPEFRMSRAFVQLWEAANDFLRRHGYYWTASRISAFNPASLASHRRFGAEHLHTALFLVVGPVQLALLTLRPFIHLGVTRGRRPVVTLRPPPTLAPGNE
jgi:hypothetical protein